MLGKIVRAVSSQGALGHCEEWEGGVEMRVTAGIMGTMVAGRHCGGLGALVLGGDPEEGGHGPVVGHCLIFKNN